MKAWAFLLCAIAAEVTASLSLKGAIGAPWLYLVVVAGYCASFACLYMVLRAGMGVGTAYGIWGAVGVVATACLAYVIFGESMTVQMVAGMVVIIAGVVCVELGSPDPEPLEEEVLDL
ncbi:cation transporter [Corynebacterium phocae]|uniref:Cation transporter n=1 Tax=Corynebacterium phocae TaxID=161895 RepID=A0A1L7D0N5_9CORY|nr:multidrug efflux SMR transporter [Corynebacterium phocae]APT91664.1 cation transporter [Corynebacterium phocae]KAA8728639.1 multidrug efflux SMR transporter [Corynebacterium phocae]